MKYRVVTGAVIFVAILALSSSTFAQTESLPAGWKPCPQCLSASEQKALSRFDPEDWPFNPRDLSGVWDARDIKNNSIVIPSVHDAFAKDQNGSGIPPANLPPLTPYGKQLFDATLTDFSTPEGTRVTNSKDPMLKCDPLGWPRQLGYNYGVEFVILPDRVLHFLEWGHTFRTIWTDGRKLPTLDEIPQPRFLGYAVGHWEEDNTFVVESTGYDSRSWISEAGNFMTKPGSKGWGLNGWPHSEEMRITERWKRTSYGTLEAQVTVIDPKVYAKPWVTEPVKHALMPNTELWEYFCVPSDSDLFNENVVKPSNGVK